MRLWSLHPAHLDRAGLVAGWREALLAQAVLADRTTGYRNHPQLVRFRASPEPLNTIGKGGSVIRALTEEFGCQINIEEDGVITIASADPEKAELAKKRIEQITAEVEIGKIYEGPVTKILDFGALINLLPGKDGLLHISQIAHERVEKVSDYLTEGQIVRVKVMETDEKGRVKLSLKALTERPAYPGHGEQPQQQRAQDGGHGQHNA